MFPGTEMLADKVLMPALIAVEATSARACIEGVLLVVLTRLMVVWDAGEAGITQALLAAKPETAESRDRQGSTPMQLLQLRIGQVGHTAGRIWALAGRA